MALNTAVQSMEVAQQAGNTALFGIGLWLFCALAGLLVGAAVAAIQIFPGRWHPAWAMHLSYWFSCPLFAGLACGVVLALKNVPPLSNARTFWLLLCMIIAGFTALIAAAAVAYLTKGYELKAAAKARQMARRNSRRATSRVEDWEDRLRSFFKPLPAGPNTEQPPPDDEARSRGSSRRSFVVPGQKAQLPPERYPSEDNSRKAPTYAGNPREIRKGQGKLDEPIK